MKRLYQLSILLLVFLIPAKALAHDFEVNGIYYYYEGNKAAVTCRGEYFSTYNEYSGAVTIPASVTYNGVTYTVTSIDDNAFRECCDLTSVTIPNSVTSIGPYAFMDCSGLTSVNIPNSVTEINHYTFCNCSGLTSISIPNSVTKISEYAFMSCGLTDAIIGNSVIRIDKFAFFACSELTSITIPNSVTTIGNDAFMACRGLTSISVESGNQTYDSRENCNAIIETASNTLIVGCKNTVIPNSVLTVGQSAFSGSGLTSITIPNSVTTVGLYAFGGCRGLTSISVESGNQTYDSRENCNAIIETASNTLIVGCKNTVIPNSVPTIGEYAFNNCSGLTSITIPNSVTKIGNRAFYVCNELTDVYCYIANPSLVTTGSDLFYLHSGDYSNRTLHVPAGSLEAYQAYYNWSHYFGNIVEMELETVPASSIELNVTTAGLNEGSSLQLTATVLPKNSDQTVLWASNNPSVATVDSNGLVTTHSVGTATITAMTTDGSNLSTTCTVTLLPVGVKGDVNGDNNINISDVTKLINYLLSGTWN